MDWFELMKSLKEESGMTNRDIAEKSGVPEPTLEKIFSGATRKPGINTVIDITHAMGGTLDLIDPAAQGKQPTNNGELPEEAGRIVTLFRKVPVDQQGLAADLVEAVLFALIKNAPVQTEAQSSVPAGIDR